MINVQFVHGPLNGTFRELDELIYSHGSFIYCMVVTSSRIFSPTIYTVSAIANMFEQHVYFLSQTPDGWVAVYHDQADIKAV